LVDGLQGPKAQVARAAQVCANGTWPMSSFLFIILRFTTIIDLRLMGTSPDEGLISYVHVAHGLEVSSQTNTNFLDETPIYYTALALHPAYRWDWFEEACGEKPEWIEKAKSMVRDI
jgi:hypothetical protein